MRRLFTYSVNLFQVFNLQSSQREGGRFKTKTSIGIYSSSVGCTSRLISGQVCESICEARGEMKSSLPSVRERSRFSSVRCPQLQHLPEDSLRPLVLLANCICLQVRSEECLTQHAIIHLSCSDLPCCSCPRVTPRPLSPALHPHSRYGGSALCQPCSGMYYRSC